MKKKLAILLVLCMVLSSLAACADTSSKKKRSKNKTRKTEIIEDTEPSIEDSEPTDDTDGPDETDDTYPTRDIDIDVTDPTTVATTTTPTTTAEPSVKIQPNANTNIKWVKYTSDDGYFTISAPEGWSVRYNNIDTIGYEIYVNDPSGLKNFYFCTSVLSFPSKDNFNYWKKAGKNFGISVPSKAYTSPKATAQSLFENSGSYFNYKNFKIMSKLGSNGYGGDVLQATCELGGKKCEGLFSSSLVDLKMPYKNMDWDMVSGTIILLTPVEDFTDWIGVLGQIFSSLEFTKSYYSARDKVWKQTYGTIKALTYNADQMSAMLRDSWEKSNRSSDITSQAYSDATLGRERVYDTQTGDVYYAKNGWSDGYSGTRYKPVEAGSDYYLKPVTGTISY